MARQEGDRWVAIIVLILSCTLTAFGMWISISNFGRSPWNVVHLPEPLGLFFLGTGMLGIIMSLGQVIYGSSKGPEKDQHT